MTGKPWSLALIVSALMILAGCASTGLPLGSSQLSSGSPTASANVQQLSSQFYGSGIGADNLANTVVGGEYHAVVSYRMRANHTGALQSINVYFIPDRPGYAAGNGGTIQVSINTDDGTPAHNPSSKVLTSYVIKNYGDLAPSRYFPQITFPSPANLVAGQLFHIVFTNIDAKPATNFMSVDGLYQPNPPWPTQPTVSDTDLATLLTDAGQSWAERKGITPTVQLTYADGWTQGLGYMEVWYNAPQIASGSSAVREFFTVSGGSKRVTSISIRAVRVNGSDPLIVHLENADGTVVEEGSIPADSIPTGASLADPYGSPLAYAWATYTFSSAHTLVSGQSYNLDFEATSTSAYQFFPVRKGLAYGFQNGTYFKDGHAEFKQDGGNWQGWTEWGEPYRTDGDLQFYFTATGFPLFASRSPFTSGLGMANLLSIPAWLRASLSVGHTRF